MTDRKQKILIVDDNEYTVRVVCLALEKAGYEVTGVLSGEEALAEINSQGLPDLAIVDYHMAPGMNGIEFCEKIHAFSDIPAIMLTAVQDGAVVQTCLEEHCEDYVRKPFSPDVLIARVRRILARFENFGLDAALDVAVDDRLTINFPHQMAKIYGKPVALTPTETKLLYVLMRQAGKPVHSDYILRRIWPEEDVFEDRLHVHVHRLRRKIEDKSMSRYIVSKRGTGYLFRMH